MQRPWNFKEILKKYIKFLNGFLTRFVAILMRTRPESCRLQRRRRCQRALRRYLVRREPKLSLRMRHFRRRRTKGHSRAKNSPKNAKSMALRGQCTCVLRAVRKGLSQREQYLPRQEETSGHPGKFMNLQVRVRVQTSCSNKVQ